MSTTLYVRLSPSVKREYERACQLRGGTMSARLRRFIWREIQAAKMDFPAQFDLDTPDEELVIEAIEENCTSQREIERYTRLTPAQTKHILSSLLLRHRIEQIEIPRPGGRAGRPKLNYRITPVRK